MTLEYLIDTPCAPKRQFGADGLLDRLRVVDQALKAPPTDPRVRAEVAEAGFALQPLAFHCLECPVNYLKSDFGCSGRIELPISRFAEQWLYSLLPERIQRHDRDPPEQIRRNHACRALLRRLRELGITGRQFDETRRPQGFAELRRGMVRRYGQPIPRYRLSTSQILELLLDRERVDFRTAELVCRTLGVWQDQPVDPEDPDRPDPPEVLFTCPVTRGDDVSVVDLKQFFLAAMTACSMDVSVSLHPVPAPAQEANLP